MRSGEECRGERVEETETIRPKSRRRKYHVMTMSSPLKFQQLYLDVAS